MKQRSSGTLRCSAFSLLTTVVAGLAVYFLILLIILAEKQSPFNGEPPKPSDVKQLAGRTQNSTISIPKPPPSYLRTPPPNPSPESQHSKSPDNTRPPIHFEEQRRPHPPPKHERDPEVHSSPSSPPTGKVIPFPNAVSFRTKGDPADNPAVLIVGGTDGSGTRRVVQILTELGVKMVSEDPETYDIHADLVGGWPPIVDPVLRVTHSVNFQPAQIDRQVHERMSQQLQKLLEQVDRDSTRPPSNRLAVGGVLAHPPDVQARHVRYGFKAPVAMTLLPYWAHLLPSSMFIHVLRDGRDIAFSANQGPVQKFYDTMYRSHPDLLRLPGAIKGIHLWSDWNTAAYHFAKAAATDRDGFLHRLWGNEETVNRSFGYFQLHSEDLVSPNRQVRFAAIYQLAKFVGSTLSEERMCCLATADTEFMGSHDRSVLKKEGGDSNSEAQLKSRYGKWKQHTDRDPRLLTDLYKHGHEGLKLFGYEPPRELPTLEMTTHSGFRCNLNSTYCKRKEQETVDHFISAVDWIIPGKCEANYGFDFVGADLSSFHLQDDQQECCRRCLQTAKCRFFTIDPVQNMCFLKTADLGRKYKRHLISGRVIALSSL